MNLNEHREILRKNDLEMMKKLDKIIYDAKPKPVPEVRPIIPKTVYMQQELTAFGMRNSTLMTVLYRVVT